MFPDDLIPRATQILLPRWTTPDERSAWLAQAFFLAEPRLYNDLRALDGQPIIILTNTITALLDAGCLTNKKAHTLAQLLTSVRIIASPDAQTEIDRLVPLLNNACAEGKSATSTGTMNAVSNPIPSRPDKPLQSYETPLNQRTPTVFISYSHTDNTFALRLINDLQDGGHAVWIDKMNIKGGAEWVRSIADGISNSYAFVSVLSPDANISRWVQREYLYADNLGKPIFPVMARASDVPFQMIDRQVLSLVEDYMTGLADLLTVLPTPRVFIPTPEMTQAPLPPSPQPLPPQRPGGNSDSAPQAPPPAPQAPQWQSQPPQQSASSSTHPPMSMPAPYVGARKADGARNRVLGLVTVLFVGAVGVTLVISTMNQSPRLTATQQMLALTGIAPTNMPGDMSITNGNGGFFSGILGLMLFTVGAYLVLTLLTRRRESAPTSNIPAEPKPDGMFGGMISPAAPPAPARGGAMPDNKRREQSDEQSKEEAPAFGVDHALDDLFSVPSPITEVSQESASSLTGKITTPVDRRALELMYINRVAAQRIDAMVEMDAPSPDDRVRVMRLDGRGFSLSDSDWAGIERQLPDGGGATALSLRRVMLMGDSLQDSITAVWAAAAALNQRAMLDPTQPIPLVIDFSRWTENLTLEGFIESEMGELGAHLVDLLRDKRAALLFDGLYTLKPERMALVESFITAHPALMAVVDLTPA